jgi:hypothetical protein
MRMGRYASTRRALALLVAFVALASSAAIANRDRPPARDDDAAAPTATTAAPSTTSSSTTSTSTTTTTLAPNPVPPGERFLVGVVQARPSEGFATTDAFAQAVGHEPDVVSVFTSFAQPFPAEAIAAIRARGATPMVTLEPWPTTPGVPCDADVATCVLRGDFDVVIAAWAIAAAADGTPLLLRFAHEPNLTHYPWGQGVVAPADYVAMWRYVHAMFAVVGATEVAWVWAFQAPGGPNPDPAPWWPGADVVDWVGIDAYNGGTSLDWGGWSPFDALFGAGFDVADRLAPHHPLMITETASTTAGGSRADWIARMADVLARERVCGLVWFEVDKEAPWSVAGDEASARALRDAFAMVRADDRSTRACA